MTEHLITYDLVQAIRSQFGNLGELEDWDNGIAFHQKVSEYDPVAGYLRFESAIDAEALLASLASDLGEIPDVGLRALAGTSEYILLDPKEKSWVNRYQLSTMDRDGSIGWRDRCQVLYETLDAVREYKIEKDGGEFKKVIVAITKRDHIGEEANPGPSATLELDDNFQKKVHLAGETKAGMHAIERARRAILSQGGDPIQGLFPWVEGAEFMLDGHTNSAQAKADGSEKNIKLFVGSEVPLPETPYRILMQQLGNVRTLRRTNTMTKGFWELSFFADNHLRLMADTMTGDRTRWPNMNSTFPIDLKIKP